MVYSNRFVMSLLVNGSIVKELHDGTVAIPFGQPYSIRFRNKHNRRAVVKFTIDGENVSGNGYIIEAHSHIDIHRHHDHDAQFLFASVDSPVAQDQGKNGPNTEGKHGVLEAKFYLEKETPKPQQVVHHHHYKKEWWNPAPVWPPINNPWQPYDYYPTWTTNTGGVSKGMSCGGNAQPMNLSDQSQTFGSTFNSGLEFSAANCCSAPGIVPTSTFQFTTAPAATPPKLLEGVTVEGGVTGQSFIQVDIDLETDYVTLRVVLKGFVPGAGPASGQQTISITSVYCTSCGAKKARETDRFCGQCGTRY
jgi:hypothetical protein